MQTPEVITIQVHVNHTTIQGVREMGPEVRERIISGRTNKLISKF